MYFFLFILLFKGSRKYQVGMCRCSEIVMFQMDPQAPQSKFFFFLVLLECSYLFFSSDDRFQYRKWGGGRNTSDSCLYIMLYLLLQLHLDIVFHVEYLCLKHYRKRPLISDEDPQTESLIFSKGLSSACPCDCITKRTSILVRTLRGIMRYNKWQKSTLTL